MTMTLYFSPTSPFARKCLVCAHELGLRDRLELSTSTTTPVTTDPVLAGRNPLAKIPTLVTADGAVIYDSRVICEYLNALGDGHLLPGSGAARWTVLVNVALADGITEAALLARYETALRPEALRWSDWVAGQEGKIRRGLDQLEKDAEALQGRVDVGTIAIACGLGYLDFRFPSLEWRRQRARLAAWFEEFSRRESMSTTRPPQV